MADANDLLNTIKKAAKETMDASKPTAVVFGKVVNVSPLQINVEQKMILGKSQLILTRNVTNFETEVTVDWKTNNKSLNANHSHEMSGDVQCDTGNITNTLGIVDKRIDLTHDHSITGKKKIKIHNGLKVDEKVVLLRIQGGQQYIVLDRVVNT